MPTVVDHDQRRAEIVLKARELISEQGPEALTLRHLAEQCGLANGALRRYFRFKRDVLLALDEDISRRFEQYAEGEGYWAQRGIAALRTLLAGELPLDRSRTVSAEVLVALRDQALADETIATILHRRVDALFDRMLKHLEEARMDGELTGTRTVRVTATILLHTVTGIGVTASLRDDRQLANYDQAAIEAIIASA